MVSAASLAQLLRADLAGMIQGSGVFRECLWLLASTVGPIEQCVRTGRHPGGIGA